MPLILESMNKTIYEYMPRAMRAYLSNYGWHFNKSLQEWAASHMRDKSGNPIKAYTKESLESLLKAYAVDLKTDHIYDALYVANMCRSDFYGSSISDEAHLAKYVADYINDPDGYEGMPFVRFYADSCMKDDCTIYWEDFI